MKEQIRLEVIDRAGWRKEVTLDRTIVHIGSDPRSDVVLEPARGAGVAPLHAQLIAANSGLGYQLVNLGDTDIVLGSSGDQVLPPRSVTRLGEGLLFKLGEFTLVFHCGDAGPAESLAGAGGDSQYVDSRYIGLKLSLPQTRLGPKRSLEGRVTVTNLGDRSGAQFNLELEGMEPDCFDIEPGPILAAGAMKEVAFRLYHRGDRPMAGDRRIVIRAEAPNAYPGEEMTVAQTIEILPLYRHSLRLLSPDRIEPEPQVGTQPAAVKAAPPPAAAPAPSPQTEDWWTAAPAVTGAKELKPKPRVPAASIPQAPAPAPSRAAAPAAQTKSPVVESVAPAVPAAPVASSAEPVRVAEVAPPAAEAMPPGADVAPLPAVEEATPPAEVAPSAPVVEQAAVQSSIQSSIHSPIQSPVQVPQVEPAPAPPKNGWAARLVQAIPFFRPKEVVPPADRAQAIVQPPAATPAMAEAVPLPVAESAPAEEEVIVAAGIAQEIQETPEASLPLETQETQEWPVEAEVPLPAPAGGETTPAAEPIAFAPIEERWGAEEANLQPVLEEQPAGLQAPGPGDESVESPESAPRAEEVQLPPAEVAPEESPRKRRALKLKASPPPETKEVWTPPVQAGPAPIEDWWTPQFGPEGVAEEERVLKLKADAPPAEKVEPAPPPGEEWWAAEAGSKDLSATRPVLKLKASLPAEKESEQATVEAGPPPPTEDWWASEAGEEAQAPAEKRRVLKLKASPPSEKEAEQTPAEGEPPPAEDWWTP